MAGEESHVLKSRQRAVQRAVGGQQFRIRHVAQVLGDFIAVRRGRASPSKPRNHRKDRLFDGQEGTGATTHGVDYRQISAHNQAVRARYGAAFGSSAAIHVALLVCLAGVPGIAPLLPHGPGMEIVLLPPAEDTQFHGLKPIERSDPGWRTTDPFTGQRLGGADLDRIAANMAVLFPFLTPGLDLDAFFPAQTRSSRLVFENPYVRRSGAPTPTHRPPLELTPAAVQGVVDRSWTRARRWAAFTEIRELCVAYDARDARLASLVASYRDQNALQPYADGPLRDLRLWAQLGLAADHAAFLGFVRDYAIANPGTEVTTELLLLVDTIAQANEDALAVLVDTNQPADLVWTRQTHPRAYDLARQIQRQYGRALERLGLKTRSAVEAYYDRQRLALLRRILAAPGASYRVNDIRFLIGSILWRQGRRADALDAWRSLTAGAGDSYAIAIAQLRAAVGSPRPDSRNIEFILKNQQGRWLSFSEDRLRRFGYRVDRF